mgnify:CR=1 FL=1
MTKDEMLWGNIRFLLLLIFSVAAIYIILCRYILNVPTEDSSELINEINHSERIFEIQHTHMQQAQNIWNEIDSLDFNIHQVQKMDEVKDVMTSNIDKILQRGERLELVIDKSSGLAETATVPMHCH